MDFHDVSTCDLDLQSSVLKIYLHRLLIKDYQQVKFEIDWISNYRAIEWQSWWGNIIIIYKKQRKGQRDLDEPPRLFGYNCLGVLLRWNNVCWVYWANDLSYIVNHVNICKYQIFSFVKLWPLPLPWRPISLFTKSLVES